MSVTLPVSPGQTQPSDAVRIPPAPHLARGAEAALLQPVARLWNWLCRSNEMTRLNRYMLCDIGLPPEASAHAPPWLDGA